MYPCFNAAAAAAAASVSASASKMSMSSVSSSTSSTSAANRFAAVMAGGLESAAAELHDLSSRNASTGNIKADMSNVMSAYHAHHAHHAHAHQLMQRSQHHPSEMHHDMFDPMSAAGALPAALAAAASVNEHHSSHHPSAHHSSSTANSAVAQLHAPSALYSAHPHHTSVNGNWLHHHASEINAHLIQSPFHAHHHSAHHGTPTPHHHHPSFGSASPHHSASSDLGMIDMDPRDLEAFAERFKQRRIKLGVTQADVGKALANLKLPGVGSLSQSTICRFESLTLSHNNMVALKPILVAWLEAAEAQARKQRASAGRSGPEHHDPGVLPSSDKKRKRTSIAAPEKRSLEAYFAVQPRPSGEKIAAIAEKLDLKKNVVRVWFCNQRQKQKRMKYSAANQPQSGV